MTNALTVIAEIRAAPGRGDALAAFLAEQVAAIVKSEPGCLAYRAHRSTSDPELFAIYETYADDAAYETHRRSTVLAGYRQRREAAGLAAGPSKVAVYREIAPA